MFRRLLTLQLIFAVAAAPFVCCCTAGHLLASPRLLAGSVPHPLAAPAGAGSPCCSHEHQPAKPSPDQKPSPTSPAEKCPCKDGSGVVGTIQTDATQADVSALLRAVSHDPALPFAGFDSTPCQTRRGQGSAPSRGPNASLPSTADLLFAHHNLRC